MTGSNHTDRGAAITISVIIPTLDEEANLARLLPGLRDGGGGLEIIVADGGSADGTQAVARANGATVIIAERGRGNQQAAGAERATGDVLLFLHADSIFDGDGLAALATQMAAAPAAVGGNFRVVFDGETRFSRRLTRFYAWMRRRGWYYGDSGIFARRNVYDAIGGMRPMPLMEDYDFVRRLEDAGRTLNIAEPALVTSSRRFEGRASHRIVWGWLKVHALYSLGTKPERLVRHYEKAK
jgi:rSAM/selenodomain-associated transferase 2